MEWLIILDYSIGEVYIHQMSKDQDGEEVLIELGLNPNNCEWMITNNLNIKSI